MPAIALLHFSGLNAESLECTDYHISDTWAFACKTLPHSPTILY